MDNNNSVSRVFYACDDFTFVPFVENVENNSVDSKMAVVCQSLFADQSAEEGANLDSLAMCEEVFRCNINDPVKSSRDKRVIDLVKKVITLKDDEMACFLIEAIDYPIVPVDHATLVELANENGLTSVELALWDHFEDYPSIQVSSKRRG